MHWIAPSEKDVATGLLEQRLCDVFNDGSNRIAREVGSPRKAFQLARAGHTPRRDSAILDSEGTLQDFRAAEDHRIRFYLPLLPDDPGQPVWSLLRKRSATDSQHAGEGERVTSHLKAIARENPLLQGIVVRAQANTPTAIYTAETID